MIRLASQEEAIEILNEKQNVDSIGLVTERLVYQPWIVQIDHFKMMFVFWMVDKDTCNVHVACKKDSILKCREMAKEILSFLFNYGVKRVVTDCPKGKISNFVIKLGFTPYKTEGETTYFEVLSWL
jgi:hypothetical protein